MFVIHLLLRNLQGHDLQQALHTLITPLVTNVITPTSPSQMSSRRAFTFRQSTTSSPSVVVSSLYIRSIYLLTAVVKVSYTANKAVRDVLYPDLISVLTAVIQNLCGCFDRSDSSNSFENCRLMWNFVLYTSSVLRGHKAVYPSFLPLVGNILQHLPSLVSQISNSVKSVMCWCCRRRSFIDELHSLKLLRLIYLLVMERGLDTEMLRNIVCLLVQVGETCIHSPSGDVVELYIKTCKTVVFKSCI